jgi:hypothetical protein
MIKKLIEGCLASFFGSKQVTTDHIDSLRMLSLLKEYLSEYHVVTMVLDSDDQLLVSIDDYLILADAD